MRTDRVVHAPGLRVTVTLETTDHEIHTRLSDRDTAARVMDGLQAVIDQHVHLFLQAEVSPSLRPPDAPDDDQAAAQATVPTSVAETPTQAKDDALEVPVHRLGRTGHGHVIPRVDRLRARCGGPGICAVCSRDLAAYVAAIRGGPPGRSSASSLASGPPESRGADGVVEVEPLEALHASLAAAGAFSPPPTTPTPTDPPPASDARQADLPVYCGTCGTVFAYVRPSTTGLLTLPTDIVRYVHPFEASHLDVFDPACPRCGHERTYRPVTDGFGRLTAWKG